LEGTYLKGFPKRILERVRKIRNQRKALGKTRRKGGFKRKVFKALKFQFLTQVKDLKKGFLNSKPLDWIRLEIRIGN